MYLLRSGSLQLQKTKHNLPSTNLKTKYTVRNSSTKLSNESFLEGTSGDYVESQYLSWKKDPSSVHSSWASFFSNVDAGKPVGSAFTAPPTLFPSSTAQKPEGSVSSVQDNLKVANLISAYRSLGHRHAKLDPLNNTPLAQIPELDPKFHGLSEADLSKEYFFSDNATYPFNGKKLSAIIAQLKETYSSTIGVEYTHIYNAEQKEWLRSKVESNLKTKLSKEDKVNLMDRLIWSDKFERFLMTKFGQDKRFGLDGCETLIPGMKTLIDTASDLGVEGVVIGMPHRGRLNVLGNVIHKPLENIFKEFSKMAPKDLQNDHLHSGDVKYHLGTSFDRTTRSGKKVHLSLMANPSHLEAVDPLVEGKTRAKQFYSNNEDTMDKVLSLQLHGDAAFAGQGVVYETLQMGQLKSYTTGGSIHIIVNNQIGFTTNPSQSRSTVYCTDLARAFDLPIFHVNGDDAEAVISVCKLAAEFRQKFKQGVIIDIISYRRFGHNELDEPKFTQPLMYEKISKQQPTAEQYKNTLINNGTMSKSEIESIESKVENKLQESYTNAPNSKSKQSNWLESKWERFKGPEQLARIMDTGVPMATLEKVLKGLTAIPSDFTLHPVVNKDVKRRVAVLEGKDTVDWATAEALAFGTLLLEGNHVRLSGQDVERGTFSHRHAVFHDQINGKKLTPLCHLDPKQAKFTVTNSFLSEYGVLGFELGYSLENPNSLIIWEAQFGDFANGAQIIIDQFLSSGEQKWYRQSGLVMLLPHGYDGQGPEHSSARLERFLQLSDSDPNVIPEMDPSKTKQIQESNIQVVNITTPANYYHVLRRQVHREFRKPLVVMSPKNLLRNPLARSPISDFDDEHTSTRFQRLIPETEKSVLDTDPKNIKKVIFCSGQVYYALVNERTVRNIKDIAIVRVEQITPFPFDLVQQQVKLYSRAQVVWCQEEPMNQGSWNFVYHHFVTSLKSLGLSTTPKYVGRPVSASPAAGTAAQHKLELGRFLGEAMS